MGPSGGHLLGCYVISGVMERNMNQPNQTQYRKIAFITACLVLLIVAIKHPAAAVAVLGIAFTIIRAVTGIAA